MGKLSASFFTRPDTLTIAKELLGMFLVTDFQGGRTVGKIVETEAYLGVNDRACHAWNGRRTARTEVMYQSGGVAYVYLIYGIHHLFNVVTHQVDRPHAVLIRGIEPVSGLEAMLERRKLCKVKPSLAAGPGVLSKALGIHRMHTGMSLQGEQIWIEDRQSGYDASEIVASPRVGVDYAGDDALLPYRFRVAASRWTSPAK